MRRLLLPGQRSLHMRKEAKRAPAILATIVELNPAVLIHRVPRQMPEMEARRTCVHALARYACRRQVGRVVIDPIDSVVQRDRAWLIEGAHQAGHPAPTFAYHHQKRHEEPLLWIADAVGWAWTRGGQLRARVRPVVTVVDL
ncbi:MAG: hypothetical protein ACRCY8_10735 [Dermatophilaceae bacterium]